jgi:hypothetical protein
MNWEHLANKLTEMHQTGDMDKLRFNVNNIIKSTILQDSTLMTDSYKTEVGKGVNSLKYIIYKQIIYNN